LILVTPDGERTMNTYLGAAQNLTTADIHAGEVESAAITYLEGYLWDPPPAKEAFLAAARIAHAADRKVALSLSDAFCVDRYRGEFLDLIRGGTVDLVFCNEGELKSLYETADFDAAIVALRRDAREAVVTRSEKGACFVTSGAVVSVPAHPVEKVVDTTGAGDLFAAGFLAGYTRGLDPATALRLGALAAGEIIGQMGARPQRPLIDLAREAGLLS
ncbi:adenosine kinase, partial [Xanthobacter autotrophicus]|uniref:adenosine kinase n=1 Tax=Xanthobacter autotrophicus TaxID=280 RepID=UPI0024A794F3